MRDLQNDCDLILSALRSTPLPKNSEAEVVLNQSTSRAVAWAGGKPDLTELSESQGAAVRVLFEGGQGTITMPALEPPQLKNAVQSAFDMARLTPKDSYRRLAESKPSGAAGPPLDTALFERSLEEISRELAVIEQRILKSDRRIKRVVKLYYEEDRSHFGLVTSKGLSVSKSSTQTMALMEVLAEDGSSIETAWDVREVRFSRDLKLESMADEVAEYAARSVGAQGLPSGKWPVLLHPRVGAMLLGLLTEALSADAIQKKKSFLQDLLGKQVAGDLLNAVDDPFLPNGLDGAPFDDEGVPHQTMTVIDRGVLLSPFYDLRTAGRAGAASNGHGIRAGLGGAPSPRPTNFFISPGKTSREDMLRSHDSVFLVKDVMGLHMANPVTGEFSLGAAGYLYEKGQFKKPVRGVTMAGRLLDLLKNVAAVGSDLTWSGSIGTPSLLVTGLALGGAS